MKAIRISLYVIAGLVILLVLAVAIFVMTFNPNRYKGEIERLVKERTGRTLALKGDLKVAVWPSLGADVNGVALSERDPKQEFLSLDSAHASVALLPLLHGSVIVDGMRVSGLKANIVKEKDGRFNFSDLTEPQPASGTTPAPKPKDQGAEKKPAEKKAEERQQAGGKAVAFDIASIQVERSAVTYTDKTSGQELALSDLNLSTGRIADKADGKLSLKGKAKGKNPDLDINVDLSGGYRFDLPAKAFDISKLDAKGVKEKQNFEAHVSAPELVVAANSAKGSAVTAALKFAEAPRNFEANLKLEGVEGSAKSLAIPHINADVTITGPDLPQKTVKIPITGSARADLEKQTANADLNAKFDESTIQAKLGLAKFSPPAYQFDLNVDKLNLDRYTKQPEKKPVSAPTEEGKAPPASAPQPAPTAQKEEQDKPVDLSALKGLNAHGRLQVGALQANGLKLANLKAEVKAGNGRLDIAPLSANLYEGSMQGAVSAQADGRVALKETLSGVAIGPLLRDVAQKDVL